MPPVDRQGPIVFLLLLAVAAFVTAAFGLSPVRDTGALAPLTPVAAEAVPVVPAPQEHGDGTHLERLERQHLPTGGTRIFGRDRFLVAYYGTAQTGALGVLGETEPDEMHDAVRRAARPFRHRAGPGDHRVQVVYELIVTIADRGAGPDGDYSHDIPRAEVERYLAAAQRHGALLLLDLQPGRSGFLPVAKRWAWALRHPWVGLALDPEWRMGPGQVPASVIGSVRAAEVNRVSAWLDRLTRRAGLPEKLLVLHQFRTTMLPDVHRIVDRPRLALVQHADGFGTRREKLATYRAIARPGQFTMGMKLFYDEDVRRFGARDVLRIRPSVRFVSYQ